MTSAFDANTGSSPATGVSPVFRVPSRYVIMPPNDTPQHGDGESVHMPSPLIACHECDLLQHRLPIPEGSVAKCKRCGAPLYRNIPDGVNRTVALAIGGLVLFVFANVFPLLSMQIGQQVTSAELIAAVKALWNQGEHALALLVTLTCILAPLTVLTLMLYVFLPLKFGRLSKGTVGVFRVLRTMQTWNMMEVFMLGILVTVVKLVKMATVVPGLGIVSFFVLIFLLAAASASMDTETVWERVDAQR
ncbi:MAG: paraquat-inducible protein A [Pseudomonadota bacterium]|nr:paraquat-inducible protein A [Pseudomonadota bacterium]